MSGMSDAEKKALVQIGRALGVLEARRIQLNHDLVSARKKGYSEVEQSIMKTIEEIDAEVQKLEASLD